MSNRLATREALFDVMEQIAEERIAARPIVQELLTRGDEVWDEEIPESWRTAGFVQELTAAGAAILETDPTRCLNFTQLALAVASSIPRETYPSPVQAFIEGRAWKEIAVAHRYQSSYDAATRAYAAAHRAFAQESALVHEQVRAQFGHATVFVVTARYDDAIELLARVEDVFRGYGDERNIISCEITRAAISYCRGDFQRAAAKHLELIPRLEEAAPEDLYTLGLLYGNAGHSLAPLGRRAEAVSAFQRAREIFSTLGMPSEVDGTDYGLAKVLLTEGDFETAIPLLYRVREAYLRRGRPENAGWAALHIVDALVATGRREEALLLTEQVLTEFIRANLNRDAITALGYLRDLLPVSAQPRQTVSQVRSYVERLRTEPARVFIPLDPEE